MLRDASQAAGMYEGFATATQIEQNAYNSGLYGYTPTAALSQFLTENQVNDRRWTRRSHIALQDFMSQQITAAKNLPAGNPTRVYWYHVDLVLTQLGAVYAGYQDARHGTLCRVQCID